MVNTVQALDYAPPSDFSVQGQGKGAVGYNKEDIEGKRGLMYDDVALGYKVPDHCSDECIWPAGASCMVRNKNYHACISW